MLKIENVLLLIMSIWELERKYDDCCLLDKTIYGPMIDNRKRVIESEVICYNSLGR